MGERKVLNKYYPPDFDPSQVPRMKMSKDRQYKVRLMAPFNMRCLNCGNYIYKATKFNAVKETVQGEEYLGMRIYRFYIRCPRCCGEITFKTDPKNTDYECEAGATRNFETWRMKDRIGTVDDEEALLAAEATEEQNAMRALEERTKESKQEMDIIDALEEIQDANARASKVDVDSILAEKHGEEATVVQELARRIQQEEDDAVAKAFGQQRVIKVKRLDDDEAPSDNAVSLPPDRDPLTNAARTPAKRAKTENTAPAAQSAETSSRSTTTTSLKQRLGGLVRPKSGAKASVAVASATPTPTAPAPSQGLALLGAYGSDSDSD